ncbi:MAG: monofunctional biosynthetic peptidoglycan transglycosylase [Chlorobiaceae bacterium]|nr:monofunctional biosynthetic peptidoglycan transglycosylase [Chlorobiaceae bacterium]
MKFLRNAFLLILLFLVVDVGRYAVYPDISKLAVSNPGNTAFMEYREAEWRREGRDLKIRQRWVPLKKVSPALIKAVLISEDNNFWKHEGFDYEAIEKAVERNVEAGEFRFGASTISQQLVKNLFLSPSKNPVRKLKEALLTWRIERSLSKRRILELYVNVAEWGDGIFGIEEAAHKYYGTSAAGLTAVQASKLAAALPNPIKYKPDGSSSFIRNRSKRIYAIMVRRGIVVPDFQEVMTPPADTQGVSPDSVTIGIPQYLIEQAVKPDTTKTAVPEHNGGNGQNSPSRTDHEAPLPDPDAGAVK